MTYDPGKHHRRSIRLKGYDYSQAGLYFITICCQNRACLFGKIENGAMILNNAGTMIKNEWLKLSERFTNIALHEYIVMPNHFHAILEIVGATLVVAQNDVAQNDVVAQNDITAPNDVVGQMDMVAQNGNGDVIHGQPQIQIHGQPQIQIHGQPQIQIHGQPQGIAPTGKTVGDVVGAFESITTVEYIRGVKNYNWRPFDQKLWQRNYWEHIIRYEQSFLKISGYIANNPANWNNDALKM